MGHPSTFHALYIFHEPATQVTYWYTLIKGISVKGGCIAFCEILFAGSR